MAKLVEIFELELLCVCVRHSNFLVSCFLLCLSAAGCIGCTSVACGKRARHARATPAAAGTSLALDPICCTPRINASVYCDIGII